jgi:nucleoside-diphosphate-sugar epimerase
MMKVFVAGASGAIGRALVPQLIEAGHTVFGMTRRPDQAEQLQAMGCTPVVCDVYDRERLTQEMKEAAPDVLVHQLTALPWALNPAKIAEQVAPTNRIRTEGTANLMAAARVAGVRRVVAQSVSFAYKPEGSLIKTENDPIWLSSPRSFGTTYQAIASLEEQIVGDPEMSGIALRYGYFYGPGTYHASDGSTAVAVREGQFPIAGNGGGMFSFIHVDDAARATLRAVEGNETGAFNIVDDEPALLREWLPYYADVLGGPYPQKVPVWKARVFVGKYGIYYATQQRGASNKKAKEQLGWAPKYKSWREGFRKSLRTDSLSTDSVGSTSGSHGEQLTHA